MAEPFPVIERARSALAGFDSRRYHAHSRSQELLRRGQPASQVAAEMGVSVRQVERLRTRVLPDRPSLPDGATVPDERIVQLEHIARMVLRMAFLLRDEDPILVWESLSRLTRRELQELAVIALAAIPIDQDHQSLYGWVLDLPAALWESARGA